MSASEYIKREHVWKMLNELAERFSSPVALSVVPDLCADTMAAIPTIWHDPESDQQAEIERLTARIEELEAKKALYHKLIFTYEKLYKDARRYNRDDEVNNEQTN
jgi:hypothetical protein